MYILGYYYIDLNSEFLLLYDVQAMCQPMNPNHVSVPDYLLIEKNTMSKYSHYFYPLVLLGNIKKTPFFITLLCATYCVYDFILVFVDVMNKQNLFCVGTSGNDSSYSNALVYSAFKTILSGIIVFYWGVAILVPEKYRNKFEIYSYIGNSLNWAIVRLLKLLSFPEFKELSKIPFEYPIRIKAAGIIAAVFCLVISLAVLLIQAIIGSYYIYLLIDELEYYLDYLELQPQTDFFLVIFLKSKYTVNAGSGQDMLRFIISLLVPVFPCTVLGTAGGLTIAMISIYNLFYLYKKIILQIRAEGEESELLMTI